MYRFLLWFFSLSLVAMVYFILSRQFDKTHYAGWVIVASVTIILPYLMIKIPVKKIKKDANNT